MTDPSTDASAPDRTLNRVTWWEIPVSDLPAGQAFYGSVFDWAFTPFGDGYAMARAGGDMVGALYASTEPPADGVRVYVNVDDLETTLRRANGAGGTVVHPRTDIGPDMGWWADFTDPDGRLIGVCTSVPPRA